MSQLSFNGAAFVITILIFGCYGAHWGEQYTSCPGKFQYPIHIDKNVNLTKTKISEFVMKGFNVSATSAELRNTGQTLLINLTFVITPTIEGGPLKGKGVYKFSHFQFHWFDAESLHSSAKQYNVSYPFEFHIIFFNENFSSANQAQAFDNGIAVLAFSIMVGDIGFDGFKDIIELMKNVTVTNNSASFINPPQLNDLMHKFIFIYFTYTGTMLTPPCSADVIWIDFEDGIFLTNEQYSALDIFGNYWALKRNPNFRGIVHKREPEFVLDEEKGGAIPLSYARNKGNQNSHIVEMLWMLVLITLELF